MVVGLVSCLAVDDPVDSVDEFLDVERSGVALFKVTIVVVLVLCAKGIDVGPNEILQLHQLVLTSHHHPLFWWSYAFGPLYALVFRLFLS